MKFLAIDTATQNCTCSIHEDLKIIAEESNQERFSHNKVLFKQITSLLNTANMEVSELDALVTGLGPGSFTGLRVGVSALKGLAFAQGIPIYGLSTLDILAMEVFGFLKDNQHEEIFSVRVFLDGKQKDFFTALYQISYKEGKLDFKRVEEISLKPLSEVSEVKPAIFNIADFGAESMTAFSAKYPRAELLTAVLPKAHNAGLLHYFGYSKKADLVRLEPDYYKDFVINKPKPNRKR